MAFTATVVDKEKLNDGRVRVAVNYTDGTNTVTETSFLSGGDLSTFQNTVQQRIAQLGVLYGFVDGLSVNTPVSAPAVDPVPTTLQADSTQFQKDWQRWKQVKTGIDAGIIDGANAQVIAFQTRVKNEFAQVITDAQAAGQTVAQAWGTALNLL